VCVIVRGREGGREGETQRQRDREVSFNIGVKGIYQKMILKGKDNAFKRDLVKRPRMIIIRYSMITQAQGALIHMSHVIGMLKMCQMCA
jgi:hypothetical protein